MKTARTGSALTALVVSLCLVLGAFSSATGINLWNADITETRAVAPYPDASIGEFSRFVSQWDAYVADHFGHRSALIKSYALFRHKVLNAYSSENRVLEWLGVQQ